MTEFWATLIGAAVGVVAGAFVQYIVKHFLSRREQSRQREALKKEMQYNLQVVADLYDECGKLRNAVNGDALGLYFGYLSYERGFFTQTAALLNNGLLYRWFPIETLQKLQKISAILNVNTTNWVNNNITQRRDRAKAGNQFDKTEAVQYVNFVEAQISEARKLLIEFIALI